MAKLNFGEIVKGAEQLSLGISMVVAVAIGTGLGFWIMKQTGWTWALFVGMTFGIAAAILNVKKAYNRVKKSMDELKDETKFKPVPYDEDDEEEDK